MISIIVPVYNAEAFLKKCVESIQAQTFAEWDGHRQHAGGRSQLVCQRDRIR